MSAPSEIPQIDLTPLPPLPGWAFKLKNTLPTELFQHGGQILTTSGRSELNDTRVIARPSPIAGVLFDKDGTLIDFRATWVPAYLGVAAELALQAGMPDRADQLLARIGYAVASRRIRR